LKQSHLFILKWHLHFDILTIYFKVVEIHLLFPLLFSIYHQKTKCFCWVQF